MLDKVRLFVFISRTLSQCRRVVGSACLTAANESTASVDTSSSGSSGTLGSSSRRNSKANSTAMLRDCSPTALIFRTPEPTSWIWPCQNIGTGVGAPTLLNGSGDNSTLKHAPHPKLFQE